MDLPTYTNIWRIEKRLYKLYDLRLPMPLPVVWIGVFVGVSVPWWVFLYLIGLPFEAPWHVIYLVPPGVLTWLSTRPVIESKRLTELLQSQLRYMSEPRTWCRMAPFDEPDEVTLTARVWRTTPPVAAPQARAERKARRAVSVKVPVPKVSRSGARPASRAAARAGAHQVDPSRVVRPAVAAAAAAAAPVADAPPAPLSRSGAASRAGATGERVVYLTQPPAPSASPVSSAPPLPSASPAPPLPAASSVSSVPPPSPSPTELEREREPQELHESREESHEPGPVHAAVQDPMQDSTQGTVLDAVQGTVLDAVQDSAHGAVQDSGQGAAPAPVEHAPLAAAESAAPAEASEAPAAPHAVPPIGTETLRRLRRLAASAEPRPQPGPEPGPQPRLEQAPEPRPEQTPEPHAVRSSGAASFTEPQPELELELEPGPLPEPEPESAAVERAHAADAADAPRRPAEDAGRAPMARETTARETTARETTAQHDAEALAQHRKGRPPRLVRPRVPVGTESDAAGEPAGEVPVVHAATEAASPASMAPIETLEPAGEAPVVHAATEAAPPAPPQPLAPQAPPALPEPLEPAADVSTASRPASQPETRDTPAREAAHHTGARPYESAAGTVGTPRSAGAAGSAGTAGVSIRAVPVGPRAAGPAGPARPSLPTPGTPTPGRPAHEEPPRLRRVEAVVGRDTSGGWRRLAQVVVGGSRTDGMEVDEARTRIPLTTSRRIMVLGCTGGAGQTTTALMLGHTLARYRDDRVLALDANTGEDTLTTRIAAESPETLSSLIESSEEVNGYLGMRAYTTRCESGLEVVGADTDDRVTQRLAERAFLADWRRTLAALDRHYRLTVIDPAAALAARLLPYADQLVLVAPASEDASEAVAMTYEWLDGHGCSDLRRRAVMVINGVSRRSLPDVEQAEAVASGRCRAIVRVPWEDELAPGRPGPVDVNHLRMGGRRAYVALAGVIVSGLAAVQAKQEVAR